MRRLILFAALAAAALATVLGCDYDPDSYLPTAPEFTGSLLLTVSVTSLPADGFSRLDVIATIDPNADPDKRKVVFTTTAGTFVGETEDSAKQTKKVDADATGEARAQLQASVKVETAVIQASVEGVDGLSKRVTVEFTAPGSGTLTLEASAESIPADGFSVVDLLARVETTNPPDKRTVKFSSSLGTLLAAVTDESGNAIVTADLNGEARAQLRSSLTVGTAIVEATLEGVPGAFKQIRIAFEPVDPGEIIKISSSSASAPADGETLTAIFADISPSLPTDQRQVRFESSMGTFAGPMTVSADASNRATVDLKSPTEIGQARVRATVSSTTAEMFLEFVHALPDRVVVLPDRFKFDVSNETELDMSVRLERDVGSVTDGTEVTYSIASASDGAPIPEVQFQGITSSENGVSKATLVLMTGATPSGFAVIRATSGDVFGEETIEFVP